MGQPKFKQTEIGLLPTDWELKHLEADGIGIVKSGKRLPAGHRVVNTPTNHPYIRVIDMKMGCLDTRNIMFVPEKAFRAISQYRIFKDDIYISVAGTLGIVGRIPERLDGANLTENANRITDINCNINFLLYWLMGSTIQRIIDSAHTHGAQPKLALYLIRNFPVPVPPLSEQSAIAAALSDVDGLIMSLEELIEKKRAIRQGAMQELLTGRKRLKGFSGEWLTTNIDRLAYLRNIKLERSIDNPSSGYCIELEHIEQGTGNIIGYTDASATISLKSCFFAGDILFGKLRAYLRKYSLAIRDGVCSTEIWVIAAKREIIIPEFLYFIIQTNEFIDVASVAYGTHMPRSDWKICKVFEVTIPKSIDEQAAIAKILSDMDAELRALQTKLDKYRAIKQGMMTELLTGRIRLIEAEE